MIGQRDSHAHDGRCSSSSCQRSAGRPASVGSVKIWPERVVLAESVASPKPVGAWLGDRIHRLNPTTSTSFLSDQVGNKAGRAVAIGHNRWTLAEHPPWPALLGERERSEPPGKRRGARRKTLSPLRAHSAALSIRCCPLVIGPVKWGFPFIKSRSLNPRGTFLAAFSRPCLETEARARTLPRHLTR